MTDVLQFLLIGLGLGGVYGLAGLGLVLVYRGTGVVNFAHGGIALIAAVIFVEARDPLGTWPAVALGLVVGAAIGAAIELLVMRRLQDASTLTRTVATIALLVVAQQVMLVWKGPISIFVPPILPQDTVGFGGDVEVGADRLILLGVLVAATVVLTLPLSRTRAGLAVSATAENRRAAASLGISPSAVALGTWVVGGALAAAAGIFVAPLTSLSAATTPLIVIPALAAALVGRLVSLPGALAGAILVGVAEAEATRYVTAPGWAAATPFLLIVVLLLVRRDALPSRSKVAERLPAVAPAVGGLVPWALAAVLAGLVAIAAGGEVAIALTASFATAILGLSIVVLTGYAGLLSLAQFALAGVGALAAGRLSDAAGVPFILAILGGALAAGATGLLFGALALRTRGIALAIVTLGLGVVINGAVLANPDYTGGPIDGTVVEKPAILGLDVSFVAHPERYALVCLAMLVLALLAVRNLRAGAVGRQLLAVRTNEVAAATLGVRGQVLKAYAFVLSSVLAGAGGALLAFRDTSFDFSGYGVLPSNQLVVLAVLGGVGFLSGGVIAGAMAVGGIGAHIVGIPASSAEYLLVVAVILLVQLVALPDGVASVLRERAAALLARARPAHRGKEPAAASVARTIAPERDRGRLDVRDLRVAFGGVVAVDGVSLVVEPGRVVGLIGPNGAGKSTVIDAITGLHRQATGTISVGAVSLDGLPTWRRAHAGIGRSFQSLELFEDMTIRDNLRVASEATDSVGLLRTLVRPTGGPLDPGAARTARALGVGDELDIDPRALPYARRRLLAVARAIARDPDVLLLDEPAAGLDGPDREHLATVIRGLVDEHGMGVLLVEHDVAMVMGLCDHVVVLDRGRVLASGTPDEVRRDPAVIAAYLGDPEAALA